MVQMMNSNLFDRRPWQGPGSEFFPTGRLDVPMKLVVRLTIAKDGIILYCMMVIRYLRRNKEKGVRNGNTNASCPPQKQLLKAIIALIIQRREVPSVYAGCSS